MLGNDYIKKVEVETGENKTDPFNAIIAELRRPKGPPSGAP